MGKLELPGNGRPPAGPRGGAPVASLHRTNLLFAKVAKLSELDKFMQECTKSHTVFKKFSVGNTPDP